MPFKTAQEGLMEVAFKSTPEQDQVQVGGEAGEEPQRPAGTCQECAGGTGRRPEGGGLQA